jgi:hypothetical protein
MVNPNKGGAGSSCSWSTTSGVADFDGCVQPFGECEYRPTLPVWESFSDQQLLGRLPSTSVDAHRVGDDSRLCVRELRRRGVTWSRIAEALSGPTGASAPGMARGQAKMILPAYLFDLSGD